MSRRGDHLVGAAVGGGGKVHAVPVQCRVLVDAVGDAGEDLLADPGAQGGSQVVAVDAPGVGRCPLEEPALPGRDGQVEHPAPVDIGNGVE
jgi:hypothetical protein